MTAFRFTTAGESHGPGLVAIVEGLPAGLELDRERARPRHGAPPARPRARRPDEDRERLGRDPLRRAPRANARQPGRGPGRQPRLRQLGGADEPVAGRRRGRGGPHAAARPRRPRRGCSSSGTPTFATCSSGPAPARPRRGWPPARSPRSSCAPSASASTATWSRSARCGPPSATTSAAEDFAGVDDSPVRCLDPDASEAMVAEIDRLRKANESLGGIFEVRAFGAGARARLPRRAGRSAWTRASPRRWSRSRPSRASRSARPGRSPAGRAPSPTTRSSGPRSAAGTARPTAPAASRAGCRTASRSSCARR